MELRIPKDWLARHQKEDEGHDTSAGSLMLDIAKRHMLDTKALLLEAVEGSRDEVSETLKLYPKEQRFRLITLPWREDTDERERTALSPSVGRGISREPAHVSESAGEYRAVPPPTGHSDESGC